jgi:hypothetical protein
MHLSEKNHTRFFTMFFKLFSLVNKKHNLVQGGKEFTFPHDSLKSEEIQKLRTALWKDDTILDEFIRENPYNFPPEDLEICDSWRHRVQGNFWVIQFLKKYAVFYDQKNHKLYGVLGLSYSFEEMFQGEVPQLLQQAVLLPFEDTIITDGLYMLNPNISFGSGIRNNLKREAKTIKERDGITTSLPEPQLSTEETLERIAATNEKLIKAFAKFVLASRLTPATTERYVTTVERFAEYLLQHSQNTSLFEHTLVQTKDFIKTNTTAKESLKKFTRFLIDSDRRNDDEIWNIEKFLSKRQTK